MTIVVYISSTRDRHHGLHMVGYSNNKSDEAIWRRRMLKWVTSVSDAWMNFMKHQFFTDTAHPINVLSCLNISLRASRFGR